MLSQLYTDAYSKVQYITMNYTASDELSVSAQMLQDLS